MTAIAEEVVARPTCSGCGDVVISVDEVSKQGPCCHGISGPWSRSEEGLYNGPVGEEDHFGEEEEPEGEETPHCRHCGSNQFQVIFGGVHRTEGQAGDGDVVFYENDAEVEAFRCSSCGAEPEHLSLEHC